MMVKPMSKREDPTAGDLATNLFGVILLALGLMLTYFSMNAEAGQVSPRIFTPVGLAVALIGGLIIIIRKDGDE